MNIGSLFTGAGGFDLGFEKAGMKIIWQCEKDKLCQKLLRKKWPAVLLYEDITEKNNYAPVELICGGDPCPIRSRARTVVHTKIPDMSGYFLAVVGKCRPGWVVRENVPASDDVDFVVALEVLGYRVVIVSINAIAYTAQNRERDFIVGCFEEKKFRRFLDIIPVEKNGKRFTETKYKKKKGYPVLTTHPVRWDSRDGYIWDGTGLRVADSEERRKLSGFPAEWFDGFSKTAVARMTGNAVVVPVVEELGKIIMHSNF